MNTKYFISLGFSVAFLLMAHFGNSQCFTNIPYPLTDLCVIEVIGNDPFCCFTTWDAACQSAYDACDSGGGGGPSTAIVVSTDTYTIPQLVTDVWLGSCVEAENITFSGAPAAFGSFTNGNLIGFESGIILSTGNAADAPGPDNGIATTSHNTPGDPDLTALSGVITNDAAIIEFDFISPNDFVSFEYVFASEEYDGFTCSGFVDSFGFFITGPGFAPNTNVALIPGTNTPVAINSVNQGFPSGLFGDEGPCLDMDPNYADYSIYFNNSLNGPEITYNGHTDVFTVGLELVPCETYSIKIAIADGGDTSYDSAVFLKAGSFSSGLDVDVVAGTLNASVDALEGCEDGYFMFINQGPEITEPTTFSFEIGGTATMGDDYTPIDNFVTFQPGQDTVYLFIEALLDGIDEGLETIVLTFPDACTCEDAPEVVLNILDNYELTAAITEDQTICVGGSTTLQVTAEGSLSVPYTYNWSTGDNTPEITVSPDVTTTYSVSVTDNCGGQTQELEVTVTVANEIEVELDAAVCAGETYLLPDGSEADESGAYTFQYLTDQGCDSIVIINLDVLDIPETFVDASVCAGDSYELPDGSVENSAGEYAVTLTSVDGCDSVVVVNLSLISIPDTFVDVSICEGQSHELQDGSTVNTAGEYPVTLVSANGCDSTVVTALQILPNAMYEIDVSICPGESYTLPDGEIADEEGTYTSELQSSIGCDSTIVVNLSLNPEYEITVNESLCGNNGFTLPDGTVVFDTGDYEVTLTTANGCDSIITINLSIQNLTVIESEHAICSPATYTLPDGTVVSQSGSFDVTVGDGDCDTLYLIDLTVHPAFSSTIQEFICAGETFALPNGIPVTSSGEYTVPNSTVHGCDSTIIYQITVLPAPIARHSALPPVGSIYDEFTQFFNQSLNSDSISWDFGPFGVSTQENPVVNFGGEAGKYPVCLDAWSADGCHDRVCFDYSIIEDFTIFIPNAFSPNEDGINDLFFIEGTDIDPNKFHLMIFDRWGELVFESRDPEEKWNGGPTDAVHYAQNEVYIYKVEIGSLSTTNIYRNTGNITVIR